MKDCCKNVKINYIHLIYKIFKNFGVIFESVTIKCNYLIYKTYKMSKYANILTPTLNNVFQFLKNQKNESLL